jgi:integrase
MRVEVCDSGTPRPFCVKAPDESALGNEGRVFPMTAELRQLLKARKDVVDALTRERELIVPYVFYRMVADGRRGKKFPERVHAFGKAWMSACAKAGCPGRIPHDLRRSAVRNLVRAGRKIGGAAWI